MHFYSNLHLGMLFNNCWLQLVLFGKQKLPCSTITEYRRGDRLLSKAKLEKWGCDVQDAFLQCYSTSASLLKCRDKQ